MDWDQIKPRIKLTGLGAFVFLVIAAILKFAIDIQDPQLTWVAAVIGLALGAIAVVDGLNGGLTD